MIGNPAQSENLNLLVSQTLKGAFSQKPKRTIFVNDLQIGLCHSCDIEPCPEYPCPKMT
jgi:hypothetical protein